MMIKCGLHVFSPFSQSFPLSLSLSLFSLFSQYLHSNLASELGRASHFHGVVLPFPVF